MDGRGGDAGASSCTSESTCTLRIAVKWYCNKNMPTFLRFVGRWSKLGERELGQCERRGDGANTGGTWKISAGRDSAPRLRAMSQVDVVQ